MIFEINEARRLSSLKEISAECLVCLRCDKRFVSEGIHNRLCDKCRKNAMDVLVYPLEQY